jgi:hypothetical protein
VDRSETNKELNSLFKILPSPFKQVEPSAQVLKPNLNDTYKKEKNKTDTSVKASEKMNKQVYEVPKKPKNNNKTALLITVGVIGFTAIALVIASMNSNASNSTKTESFDYESKKMSVAEIEQSSPINFLDAYGTYNQNLLGTKLKVHGVIKNSATTIAYKDVVIQVSFYSKTKSLLGTEKHTIYEVVKPNHTVSSEVKVPNYSKVNTIDWDVVSAKVY